MPTIPVGQESVSSPLLEAPRVTAQALGILVLGVMIRVSFALSLSLSLSRSLSLLSLNHSLSVSPLPRLPLVHSQELINPRRLYFPLMWHSQCTANAALLLRLQSYSKWAACCMYTILWLAPNVTLPFVVTSTNTTAKRCWRTNTPFQTLPSARLL